MDTLPSLDTDFSLPTVRHEITRLQDSGPAVIHVKKEENPARVYPFTLDPFQAISIAALGRRESVLVAAHTSAGKTVVAEYAVAMALRDRQRVIYTSPIKALSNQKYRELLDAFGDVGLMTGDVTISPTASCLVMTTEILRSMLYRGSEVVREVAWIIYDEIHYMRDRERGVVWEETLILAPSSVRFVFLSATIPNAREFADWIASLHSQPVHVVSTEFRPTPLQHYLFGAGGDGIHLAIDEKKTFKRENVERALSTLAGATRNTTDLAKIIKLVMTRGLHPAIVFSFSRRECETNAIQMASVDFNDEDEKELISIIFQNAIAALSEEDSSLPQISSLLPLLRRGIALHHSGLLPVLREVVEILFQEGLIKVLFATETFAIGLNMPARTVVFTSLRKFDGSVNRLISSGEYIQMSGRAGRRGLDERGIVIVMLSERIEISTLQALMCGSADPLHSAFRLSFNMLLNLMRIEGFRPETILEQSFMMHQQKKRLPELSEALSSAEALLRAEEASENCSGTKGADIERAIAYLTRLSQAEAAAEEVRKQIFVNNCSTILPFLQPGRLVKDDQGAWGVVLSVHKLKSGSWIVDLFRGEDGIEPVAVSILSDISSLRMILPGDLRNGEGQEKATNSLHSILAKFENGKLPQLSPLDDLGLRNDASFVRAMTKRDALKAVIEAEHFSVAELDAARNLINAREAVIEAQRALRTATLTLQGDELRMRRRILHRLGFTQSTQEGIEIPTLKGRVACEISATGTDELTLTELLLSGVFSNLSPDLIAALLSIFVCEESSEEGISGVPIDLREPFLQAQEIARSVGGVIDDVAGTDAAPIVGVSGGSSPFNASSGSVFSAKEILAGRLRPTLMEVVVAWARGTKFAAVCKLTDVFEGSIVRTMRRLEELLRQMTQGAKAIGSVELELKFAESITLIRRDIVFANSLYL